MNKFFALRSAAVLAAALILFCSPAAGQALSGGGAMNYSAPTSTSEASATSAPVFRQLNLVGTYRPDGSFRPALNTAQARQFLSEAPPDAPDQMAVPMSFRITSNERVVENPIPPARANQPVHGHSIFALLRDNIITFAYGRAKVLNQPTHVITDSKGRLIVSDPQLAAVHVLDASGKGSFRIAGGPMRRLQMPGALALDADDNIYVADTKLGLVSVFDSAGKFLRYIGEVQGESMFDSPNGIAIDPKSRRLYVVDTTANELIVLDLQGKVLLRVGAERSQTSARLLHPSEVAISKDEVIVLDHFGSRIQVLDLNCSPKSSFAVRNENGPPFMGEVGLTLDSRSRIYISNLLSSAVRVYSHDGEFLGYMGRNATGQKFNFPLGIWVDPDDRLFVSDSNLGRIQVFQIATVPAIPALSR